MSNANLIKELREKTSARINDCVKALKECGDDLEKAVEWLRKQNLVQGAKASTRGAEEGRLGIKVDGGALTLVELTATTDFSAKNDDFKKLLNQLVDLAAAGKVGTPEALLKKELGGRPVEEVVKETAGKIGENIAVKRVLRVEGAFGYYLHSDYKQGAVVELDGVTGDKAAEVGKDLAMHIVFAKPRFLNSSEVPAAEVAKEKDIISEKLKADPKNAKKPADILDKIATGQLGKFYAEICLLDQAYYKENKINVTEALKQQAGPGAKVKKFHYFKVGA
ncbi:MAG: translation elongation factor Ts [Planctomycetes bacterium]|nr:translation elongation factor Ts [Planctomycetota bacterium]